MIWSTTAFNTRILLKKEDHSKLGYVRNVGCKQWYAEDYSTKEAKIFKTLIEGKTWLENRSK